MPPPSVLDRIKQLNEQRDALAGELETELVAARAHVTELEERLAELRVGAGKQESVAKVALRVVTEQPGIPRASLDATVDRLRPGTPRGQIDMALSQLVKREKISRLGSGRDATYRPVREESVSEPPKVPAAPTRTPADIKAAHERVQARRLA